MLIDTNASFGHWPFARLPKRTLTALETHLTKNGIGHALISHLETLFTPDPHPYNLELIKATKRYDRFTPVPVLNLYNPDWLEGLETYRKKTDLKAVKIYPNFHNYSLNSGRVNALIRYLSEHGIRLIINVRMLDERHQYFGLKVNGVPLKQLAGIGERFPEFRFLCTGLYRPEIFELADQCETFSTDMSFADWHDLINELLKKLSPDRLFFGSHTPLMVTKANTMKLEVAPISAKLKKQIGQGNAKKFFKL
ncbi:MAG: amidohydrolase family protein [Opitutaceae bacterium]|nr:amidohydrolase family protein [Opitutaceae bacterium]